MTNAEGALSPVKRVCQNDLSATTTDGAFFYKIIAIQLAVLCVTRVIDCLHAGNQTYSKQSQSIEKKIQCRDRIFDEVQFGVINIRTFSNRFFIHQENYSKKIDSPPKYVNFAQYSSPRANLIWLLQTRPDIACAVAQSKQVTETRLTSNPSANRKLLNAILLHLGKTSDHRLLYPQLEKNSPRLQTYSDAPYNNNYDGTPYLGYIDFQKTRMINVNFRIGHLTSQRGSQDYSYEARLLHQPTLSI